MQIYRGLAARWYRLLDPTEDHADEAECYAEALLRGATPPVETLLELGAGAGNNAFFMKRRFRSTLTDLSPEMLGLSRGINPECAHHLGDMRSLRLGAIFDAVFVHDAVMYITTREDLRAVAATAFAHTRPGGAALFAPDCVRETYRENTDLISNQEDGRALRGLEWVWDPDPADDTMAVDYVFALREDGTTTVHHEQHLEGLFSRDTWSGILAGAGFRPERIECVLDGRPYDAFLARRP